MLNMCGARSSTNGSSQTCEAVRPLLLEDDLPVLVADGEELAVVAPVWEQLARPLVLAGGVL